MTWSNHGCHFQHCLSSRSLSRKDGATFQHDPLPSCKFLCCFYSLAQAGESQAESEILFSSYDSLVERRNNNANIHLKEVTVWYRLTNVHLLLVQKRAFPQLTFHAQAWFCQTMEILFWRRFCLTWSAMLFNPQYQNSLLPNRFGHEVREQLPSRIISSQAGKSHLRHSKSKWWRSCSRPSAWDPSAPSSPPPAGLVSPWKRRSCPALWFFSQIKGHPYFAK